jgi:hypothetical protein
VTAADVSVIVKCWTCQIAACSAWPSVAMWSLRLRVPEA